MHKIVGLGALIAVGICQFAAAGEISWKVSFQQGAGIEKYQKHRPLFGAKGNKIALVKQPDGTLEGRLKFPFEQGEGRKIILAESTKGKGYDRLLVDANNDGSHKNDKAVSTTINNHRDNFWSSFNSSVTVTYPLNGKSVTRDYPVGMWAVTEDLAVAPDVIRFSATGFLIGQVSIDGVDHKIVVSDINNDGQYTEGDPWTVRPENAPEPYRNSRAVGDFAWANEEDAYVLSLSDNAASKGVLKPHNPGLSKAEDLVKRDPYHFDRLAKRAEKPLHFSHDIQASIKQAQETGSSYFIDFETTWCGPCKQMDAMVYVAQDVVDAAKGIICIKADGDEEETLVERHRVEGYPTGILFTAEGKEIARFVGYRGVADMKAFLSQQKEGE